MKGKLSFWRNQFIVAWWWIISLRQFWTDDFRTQKQKTEGTEYSLR
jgi:hypothetical protein